MINSFFDKSPESNGVAMGIDVLSIFDFQRYTVFPDCQNKVHLGLRPPFGEMSQIQMGTTPRKYTVAISAMSPARSLK